MGDLNRCAGSAALLALMGFAAAFAARHEPFIRVSEQEHLAQAPVSAVVQDRQGFLWFGTEDGLIRYDGYSFTSFRKDRRNPSSLSDNFVSCLHEDTAGNLWIGTFDGLCRMDARTGAIRRYSLSGEGDEGLNHKVVQAVCMDRSGVLWIGTRSGGLDQFDPATGRLTHRHLRPGSPDDLGTNQVRAIVEDRKGRLWVATSGAGLQRYDPATRQWVRFRHDPDDPASLGSDRVMALHFDRAGRLWIGTSGAGVNRFDETTGRFQRFAPDPATPGSLSNDRVHTIIEDGRGFLWVGTEGGLNRFDSRTGRFNAYTADLNDPLSPSHDYILSLLADRSGILWIGTFNGLNKLELARKPFHAYQQQAGREDGLSSNAVWSVYEDRAGVLWIGTDGGGLNRRDPSTHQIRHWLHDAANRHSISDNAVQCILEDSEDSLWLGTYHGLCRLDRRSFRFERFMAGGPDSRGLSDDRVYCLQEDSSRNLWIGTHSGLDRLDRATGRVVPALRPGQVMEGAEALPIFSIASDGSGGLWLGTSGEGLVRFHPDTGAVRRYFNNPADPSSLVDDDVFAILPDRAGGIWLGTGGGLDRFDPRRGTFSHITEKDGLPSDLVLQILQAVDGSLWMSTFRGIVRYDPTTGRTRTYDRSDGLPTDDFVQGASCRDRHGRLYFGSSAGLVHFIPGEIRDNPYIPPVVLTSFKVFNTEHDVGEQVSKARRIRLDYRQNFFSFEFSALNFLAPEKNRYAYRMEGFDREWIQAGHRRYAAFTNLDPGTYTFRVRATNNDGVWNLQGLSVQVVIDPPFWKTGWFQALAVVVFIVLSNLFFLLVKKTTTLVIHWRKTHFISHYRILKKLGRGGMGTVFKVEDLETKRVYALKVLNEEVLEDTDAKQRFIEESSICGQIDHPCVIRVHEKGEIENTLYFTMDYYDGLTLRELLAGSPLRVENSLLLFRVLLDVFHEIHRQGVIHRDIKPGNIMIGRKIETARLASGELDEETLRANLRILDFGIARLIDTKTRTQTGLFVGSLHYMPPEYLSGKKARDVGGDHYALGAILYELLCGRTPYQGEDFAELLFTMVHTRPPAPSKLNPAVPEPVSDFAVRLVEPDESRRLSGYEAIRDALGALQRTGGG